MINRRSAEVRVAWDADTIARLKAERECLAAALAAAEEERDDWQATAQSAANNGLQNALRRKAEAERAQAQSWARASQENVESWEGVVHEERIAHANTRYALGVAEAERARLVAVIGGHQARLLAIANERKRIGATEVGKEWERVAADLAAALAPPTTGPAGNYRIFDEPRQVTVSGGVPPAPAAPPVADSGAAP